jgi:hypothetical protein
MSHALLNASGASRWLNCPPSARLEEQFPDSTSEAAAEGTLAHALGELKLQKYFTPMAKSTFTKAHNKIKKDPLYTKEMEDYTDEYLDYIKETALRYPSQPTVTIEKKVDFSSYAPQGFGTADCILISGDTLHIIDLKYGKGVPVSAEKNPQMRLYALGALKEYDFIYAINKVEMVIFQPRLDNISVDAMEAETLLNWGNAFVKPLAQQAFKGEGVFTPGDHCRFCRAKAVCRARSEINTALEDFKGKLPPVLSNEEVGDLLLKAQDLAKWAEDLKEHALKMCLAGETVPGWKAVEGRSNRCFTDTDAAFKELTTKGLAKEEVLYIKKPITLTETEKLLGKKEFETVLSEFIIKPPGKPALAKATDKREPLTLKTDAKTDFANIQV